MKKRALIVGCNYPGSSAPLRGCVNDAHTMRSLLVDHFGFDPADITLMLDTDPSTTSPTGANIKASARRPLCWPAPAHHAGQSAEAAPCLSYPDASSPCTLLQTKLRELVAATQSGDVLMFHFSGHGCVVPQGRCRGSAGALVVRA